MASTTDADFVLVNEEEWLARQDDEWEEVCSEPGCGVGVDELVQSQNTGQESITESKLEGVEDFEVISKKSAEETQQVAERGGIVTSILKNARSLGSAIVSYTATATTTTTATTTSPAQTAKPNAPHQWPPVVQEQYCAKSIGTTSPPEQSDIGSASGSLGGSPAWNPAVVPPQVEVSQM